MREYFHPKKQEQLHKFWRAHDTIMDKLKLFAEIQAGPNPLTDEERHKLAAKYPQRYSFMVKGLKT